jgi:hypothetical protein
MSAMSLVRSGVASWARAIGVAALLVAVAAPSARAGLLLTEPCLENGAVVGVTPGIFFTADIEYAVYQERADAIHLNFTGTGLYIYAYQLFNYEDSDPVWPLDNFCMGVNGNEHVANLGYYDPDGNSCLPTGLGDWSIGAAGVTWLFSDSPEYDPSSAIVPGGHSPILYFTSPAAPTRAGCTLGGGLNQDVPADEGPYSPQHAPEPTTAMLMMIGAITLLAAGVVRRRNRGK